MLMQRPHLRRGALGAAAGLTLGLLLLAARAARDSDEGRAVTAFFTGAGGVTSSTEPSVFCTALAASRALASPCLWS